MRQTDLAGGDPTNYHSLFGKHLALDDIVQVYPGHDYGATPTSTIGNERQTNYVLVPRTLQEFMDFMAQP
jgi:glyoxylase-like metal-dependent hydrolase (beta-lactamase superfamily II)